MPCTFIQNTIVDKNFFIAYLVSILKALDSIRYSPRLSRDIVTVTPGCVRTEFLTVHLLYYLLTGNRMVLRDADLECEKRFFRLSTMAIRVVEFSNGGYKIRKIFARESTYSKEIIEF